MSRSKAGRFSVSFLLRGPVRLGCGWMGFLVPIETRRSTCDLALSARRWTGHGGTDKPECVESPKRGGSDWTSMSKSTAREMSASKDPLIVGSGNSSLRRLVGPSVWVGVERLLVLIIPVKSLVSTPRECLLRVFRCWRKWAKNCLGDVLWGLVASGLVRYAP
jgi:hypothetical protein